MRIGVFVGSFNPVHKGHIKIANYLVDNNYVDKLLIVPTGSYWDKKNIDVKYRIEMLERYETDRIIIERELNNLEYTYQLINELKKRYKNDELILIMGADNIISFDKWKNYEELLKLELIIYKRNNFDIKHYLDRINKKDKYIIIDNVESINISSTTIRETINDFYNLEELIDKDVLDYIIKNELYK